MGGRTIVLEQRWECVVWMAWEGGEEESRIAEV
jgi:hypothetical protein